MVIRQAVKITAVVLHMLSASAFAAAPMGDVGRGAEAFLVERINPALAVAAEMVEVVYVKDLPSHLEYLGGTRDDNRSGSPQPLVVEQPRLRAFGSMKVLPDGSVRRGKGAGGYLLDIGSGRQPADMLQFPLLRLAGTAEGRWKLAFADVEQALREENTVVAEISGPLPRVVSLEPALRAADLRKGALLAFLLDSPRGRLALSKVESSAVSRVTSRKSLRAMWMWDGRRAVTTPQAVIEDLRRQGVDRVYLQLGNDLEGLYGFLAEARRCGIAVWGLDGAPGYILDAGPLLDRLQSVKEYNIRHPDASFGGFQIDVEPHLLPDFRLRLTEYGRGLARVISLLRERGGQSVALSAAIPFWYDELLVDGRSLAWHVMKGLDEVAIMSYRTSFPEIEAIAATELAYGDLLGIPVFLGVETSPIPDERHVVFKRCRAGNGPATSGWCREREYEVPGDRISFNRKTGELSAVLARRPANPSFAGWVVHSYETAPR